LQQRFDGLPEHRSMGRMCPLASDNQDRSDTMVTGILEKEPDLGSGFIASQSVQIEFTFRPDATLFDLLDPSWNGLRCLSFRPFVLENFIELTNRLLKQLFIIGFGLRRDNRRLNRTRNDTVIVLTVKLLHA
jgi:hypothetical protein